MAADGTTLSTADNTDPFIPKYTDGTPIQWDGNYAHIDGALYETGRYYKRTGLFQLFFKHRAVALSNGRIAVESFNAVWFTSGRVTDSLTSGKMSRLLLPLKQQLVDLVHLAAAGEARLLEIALPGH